MSPILQAQSTAEHERHARALMGEGVNDEIHIVVAERFSLALHP
jgi:hypothetical protein